MSSECIVSGQCIASLIHRLSLRLGDFEAILYGRERITKQRHVGDLEEEKYRVIQFIHFVAILNTPKMLHDPEILQKIKDQCPSEMLVLGWASGRREVPVRPTLGDHSTRDFLTGLQSSHKGLFTESPLIYGCFTQNSKSAEESADMDPALRSTTKFEYKFFSSTFEPVKVEMQNLHSTDTKYNQIPSTYSVPASLQLQDKNLATQEAMDLAPELLWAEAQSLLRSIETALPAVRGRNSELERAIQRNSELKQQLYK